MELTDLLGLGVSAISGGITGLIGMGLKGLFAWLGAKAKLAEKKADQAHELALLDKQIAARGQELENEARIASEETRQRSYDYANVSQEVWKWVASLVTLMRPVLTIALVAIMGWLLFRLLNRPIPYVDSAATIKEVIAAIIYLTTTAVTWWFGDRPPQQR